MPVGWSKTTKKALWEAREDLLQLLDVATRKAAEQEALAGARLAEVQSLQDEVVDLQVHLGDALDKVEKKTELLTEYREMVSNRDGAIRYLEERMKETPGQKLRESVERFARALLRRG